MCLLLAFAVPSPGTFARQKVFSASSKPLVPASSEPLQSAFREAETLSAANRLPEALAAYQNILTAHPHDEKAALGLAELFRRLHNDQQARQILDQARSTHPRSPAISKSLGVLEMDARAYDPAIANFRKALAFSPADIGCRNLLATAYIAKGDPASARAQLDQVLRRDPANQLARLLRAQIYVDARENENALADAESVVATHPDYWPGRLLLAKILVRDNRCARAAEILQAGASPGAADAQSLYIVANAYKCAGQLERARSAREAFEEASKQERTLRENGIQSLHLVEQANAMALQNNFNGALDLLRQSLEKNPANASAYSQQAKIYLSMQQQEKAREAIAAALRIQPYQPDFLYVAGVIAEARGELDQALSHLNVVAQINPGEADAYFEMGKIWLKKNERRKARAALQKAVSLAPGDEEYARALHEASEEPR